MIGRFSSNFLYQNILKYMYIFIFYTRVVSFLLRTYLLWRKGGPFIVRNSKRDSKNNASGVRNVKEIEPHICFAWNAQPECRKSVEATTRRPSVMGGECIESAPARHALTTGGDTCEIERCSFGVRAEDVMGNMRPSVFVQYAKLLRRYCNNFRNKKLSAFSSLYSGCLRMRTGVEWGGDGGWINLRNNVSILISCRKTKLSATTITRQCVLINSHLIYWKIKLATRKFFGTSLLI